MKRKGTEKRGIAGKKGGMMYVRKGKKGNKKGTYKKRGKGAKKTKRQRR